MLRTILTRPDLDDPALHARWQALAQAARVPAFLSWTWVGCCTAERYPNPVLAEAFDGDMLVGLALFNRTRGALHLHSSGDRALDAIFMEHNGAVATHGDAFAAILAAIRPEVRRVEFQGIDDTALGTVRAAGGITTGLHSRPAPYARLWGDTLLDAGFSRNARAQLRRSDRSYAEAGPLVAARAETVAEASAWFDAMLPLHAATWSTRGIDSGFLREPVLRFARALIARGVPTGEVDILKVNAGPRLVGILMNLVGSGRVLAYQGGFDYAGAAPHEKPGLACHHAAMQRARTAGALEYDFLAGDARYKRSLSNAVRDLHWLVWKPRPALFGVEAAIRRWTGH